MTGITVASLWPFSRNIVLLFLVAIITKAANRLIFHPLAKIPGPKLAALSSWYECYYDVFKPGKYVFKIAELHRKYGHVVRIGPNQVSISDPDFVDAIYAPGAGHRRDKDADMVKALGVNTSVGGAIPHDLHRRRREALNPFFSHQSIARLMPRLEDKANQLEEQFQDAAESGEVLNLSDLYFAFASDIVSQYSFGHSQDMLANPTLASARRNNVASVLRGVKINTNFPWIRETLQHLPPKYGARFTPSGVRDMIQFRRAIRKEVTSIINHETEPKDEDAKSIFYELRDSPKLPDSEKSAERLEDEGTLMVMAGTESTAKALTAAHYYLLANPSIMAKLRLELASSPCRSLADLEQLPYLGAIIQETHRLTFGLTGRNPRVCPDRAISYADVDTGKIYVLPPGTSLSTSTLLVHTNESIFPDPWTFDPDRWLGPEGQSKRKYQLSFSSGPRMCIGKHLANAELAVAIRAMARWDMGLVETTEDDVKFLHDYHVATPKLNSQGVRATVLSPSETHPKETLPSRG